MSFLFLVNRQPPKLFETENAFPHRKVTKQGRVLRVAAHPFYSLRKGIIAQEFWVLGAVGPWYREERNWLFFPLLGASLGEGQKWKKKINIGDNFILTQLNDRKFHQVYLWFLTSKVIYFHYGI